MAQLREGSVIKKAAGDEIIATTTDAQAKADTAEQNAKDYVDSKVQTDVPSDAKFTDTVYNHPSSHPASIITESTTKRFVSDAEKTTWNDANSKKHIHSNKSIIDELDDIGGNLIYKGKEIGVGGVFTIKREEFIATQGQTVFNLTLGEYTPNANRLSVHIFGGMVSNNSFVETSRTSFAFKSGLDEGDKVIVEWIETVDIEGLYQGHSNTHAIGGGDTITPNMIGAAESGHNHDDQYSITNHNHDDKYSITNHNHDGVYSNKNHTHTNSQVGLNNVDNVKQMPISNGVLENYREKLTTLSGTSTIINLSLGNVFTHLLTGNTTYSITNAVSGQAHSFTLIINIEDTVRTLIFPSSVKWQGGKIPDMSEINKTYILTFMSVDGGTTWLGMFGGEF